jgi:hypothetical protein
MDKLKMTWIPGVHEISTLISSFIHVDIESLRDRLETLFYRHIPRPEVLTRDDIIYPGFLVKTMRFLQTYNNNDLIHMFTIMDVGCGVRYQRLGIDIDGRLSWGWKDAEDDEDKLGYPKKLKYRDYDDSSFYLNFVEWVD